MQINEAGLNREALLDEKCINTIRFLAVDMVQKAKSGHPGTPMGATTLAYVLWDRFLKHHPRNPTWADRDRFILSPGHALTGGSADLSPSTKTTLVGYGDFGWQEYCGHNIHFGVREHTMGAIVGGMALHGGMIPYAATFLTFSDYMRPPMRLAALMGIRVIYLFTHDSIGMGQDGPTHQPIEHLMNLRAIPHLVVIRPADATESAEAWRAALLNKDGPTALVMTRRNVPVLDRTVYPSTTGLQRGGYILWENTGAAELQVLLCGTGSEVHSALEAGKRLATEGTHVRVISLPSWELFDRQPADYRERIFPPHVRARVAVEAGIILGWEHYVGLDGAVVGMHSFGASAPAEVLYEQFGITAEHVVQEAKGLLQREPKGKTL